MSRISKWTLVAAIGVCLVPASRAAGQTAMSMAVYRPGESRTTVTEVNYPRGWYGGPRYYGPSYGRPYAVRRPNYGYYSRPRVYSSFYGSYYGPRVYSTPYYGWGYYGYGSPYYGYTYGRPAFRYGVGWY
jgi:hypothetical protein